MSMLPVALRFADLGWLVLGACMYYAVLDVLVRDRQCGRLYYVRIIGVGSDTYHHALRPTQSLLDGTAHASASRPCSRLGIAPRSWANTMLSFDLQESSKSTDVTFGFVTPAADLSDDISRCFPKDVLSKAFVPHLRLSAFMKRPSRLRGYPACDGSPACLSTSCPCSPTRSLPPLSTYSATVDSIPSLRFDLLILGCCCYRLPCLEVGPLQTL